MKKLLIGLSVMLLAMILLSSCEWFATYVDDATASTPDTSDITDTTALDTSDIPDTIAPDTSDIPDTIAPDTSDTASDTAEAPAVSTPLITKEEWDAFGFGGLISDHSYNAICALLIGDIDEFAKLCGVNPAVYDSMRTMKIGEWRLYSEDIPSVYDPGRSKVYPVLELEVIESESEYFCVGTHHLVFDEGLQMTFTKRELFAKPPKNTSHAMRYVASVGSDRDFSPISAEGMRQFLLGDFIVGRLDDLAGDYEPRTEAEIREYAEKYLGVDPDTLLLEESLEKVDGGYIRVGRGSASDVCEYLSEEIRDGVTVVTVQFFADYSKTVPSRTVEFYMELLDGEYRPIKTVIIQDSEFGTVYYST